MSGEEKPIHEKTKKLLKNYRILCICSLMIPILLIIIYLVGLSSIYVQDALANIGFIVSLPQFILYLICSIGIIIQLITYSKVMEKNVSQHNYKRMILPGAIFIIGIAAMILTIVSIFSYGFLVITMILTSIELFFVIFLFLISAAIEDQLKGLVNTTAMNTVLQSFNKNADASKMLKSTVDNMMNTSVKMNTGVRKLPPKPVDKEKSLGRLRRLFEITERVKIDDVANVLGFSREELINFLIDNKDSFEGIKIVSDELVVQEEDIDTLMQVLDEQFTSWDKKDLRGKKG